MDASCAGDFLPAGGPALPPERQVAAGGMAREGDPAQVEAVLCGDRAQMVDAGSNVPEGARIAAAGVTDATVFEVPDRIAVVAQVGGHIVHQLEARQVGPPAAAVDQDNDGMRTLSARQPEFAELEGVRAVGDAFVGGGAGKGQQLAEGDGRAGLDRGDQRRRGRAGGGCQKAGKGGSHQAHQAVLSKSPFHRRGGSL